MKKVIALIVFIVTLSAGSLMAQQGGGNFDTTGMRQRQFQQLKDSDLKLTDLQADSVVSIMAESRQQMRGFRDLSEDERKSKMKEMNDYRMKRWSQALGDEALAKKVAEFYEKQRANRMGGRP